MSTLTYPDALPGPMPGSFAPRGRRATSGIDGPLQQRARQRDAAGLTSQYTYTYTPEEMVVWRAWYRETLLDGRRWFAHRLPGRGGLLQRLVRYVTVRQQLLGVGIYRVEAQFEERGASLAPIGQIPVLFLGAIDVAGGNQPVDIPDHQAGDLLVVFDNRGGVTVPPDRPGFTQIDGGTFGSTTTHKVQWWTLPDSDPYAIASDIGVVTLAALFRGAAVVDSVVSAVALATSLVGSPDVVSEQSGGSYFLQYGSCGLGSISWSGAGQELIHQDPSLGGGDTILISSGGFAPASLPGSYTSSQLASLAACVVQLVGAGAA